MTFSEERFRSKSTFNPRNKDAVIETYLSYSTISLKMKECNAKFE